MDQQGSFVNDARRFVLVYVAMSHDLIIIYAHEHDMKPGWVFVQCMGPERRACLI